MNAVQYFLWGKSPTWIKVSSCDSCDEFPYQDGLPLSFLPHALSRGFPPDAIEATGNRPTFDASPGKMTIAYYCNMRIHSFIFQDLDSGWELLKLSWTSSTYILTLLDMAKAKARQCQRTCNRKKCQKRNRNPKVIVFSAILNKSKLVYCEFVLASLKVLRITAVLLKIPGQKTHL